METKTKKMRLRRRERRLCWKAEKKARRAELKARYQYAPGLTRFWNLYAKKPVKFLFYLALIAGLCSTVSAENLISLIQPVIMSYYDANKDKPQPKEKIYAESPLDEEGAARIDAIAPVDADDTWTICVYFVGSNLEDMNENDLSLLTSLQTAELARAYSETSRNKLLRQLARFAEEMDEYGLEMPSYLYEPVKPVASSTVVTQDVVVADRPGCASTDIEELTSGLWSDRIRIVIQTGGAKRWSNQMINPNRTQRFLYENGEFTELESLPLQPAARVETLADFLRFCKENYRSDHQMLVLWNHGSGAFGYGQDSITGELLSLNDIRAALSSVYRPDRANPAFDIIGFDACLMSSLEVTHALDGFADYYALSEETEPGDGWDYGPWLQAMTDDPTMSPARVAREIADTYTDYYMTHNLNVGSLAHNDVTFSVLDAKKCAELYDAYLELARAQLVAAAEDIGVLAEIGRCADKSTHFVSSMYTVMNTVDLANYVDYMVDSFPEACSRVKELVGEAVLYHRENGSLSDAEGISVYIPGTIDSVAGIKYLLDYVDGIAEDDSVRALYYYKVAGCLNGELLEHVATLTDKKPKTLDPALFRQFTRLTPDMEADGFSLPVGEELQGMIQDYQFELGSYDEDAWTVTYYGRDNSPVLDGDGALVCGFDGTWFCLDGVPLAVEVASNSASSVEYRAKVLYNGKEAYLIFDYDRDTGDYTIDSVRQIPGSDDAINYLSNTRSRIELEPGSKITPLYVVDNFDTNESSEQEGKTVKLKESSKITRKALPDGYYLSFAVISDQRSENYCSAVVGQTVSGGRVTDREVDTRFLGRE